MVLPLSTFWMTSFLFSDKCLNALNSDAVKFSDGLWSLEKVSYEDKAVSSNLAYIEDKSSLCKFSCFTARNSNSKGSKNSEYSIDLGFTEKLRPLHNTLFSTSLNPLSFKFIKWSNTLKQFVDKLPTNCLSVFEHFVGLALKGLIHMKKN